MRWSVFFILWFLSLNGFAFKKRQAKVLYKESMRPNNGLWTKQFNNDRDNVRALLKTLKKSQTGKTLLLMALKKARKNGLGLYDVIKVGKGSLTDTTLIRRYHPTDPHSIDYESKSIVYVNKDLTVVDATLDLAHELTHFIYREPFNPYVRNYRLKDFIESTVEGRGGEVEAYLRECKVYFELFSHLPQNRYHCDRVRNEKNGGLSRIQGIKEFYKMGRFHSHFLEEAKGYGISEHSFPHLSKGPANFISSAYGLPYPLAALQEYIYVMQKACENDFKRIGLLQQTVADRYLASIGRSQSTAKSHEFKQVLSRYKERCSQFIDVAQLDSP